MGLLNFLRRLLFGKTVDRRHRRRTFRRRQRSVRLVPLCRTTQPQSSTIREVDGPEPPYRFARFGRRYGRFFDLCRDGDEGRLAHFNLPRIDTPETLAAWFDLPLGKVAWLVHRFSDDQRPASIERSHYYYRWLQKRSRGWRLIEAPKATLKAAQRQVLSEILDRIPPHNSAHGFVARRSIVTNAQPHTGNRVLVKLDLENFYATVTFARVVSVFRSVGYCREVALWLARLTTSALPANMPFPEGDSLAILPFLPRHLPQGAPTSPALANLSAFSLDLRLTGLARSFSVQYTRYADDLTFSGPERLLHALPVFIPLAKKIVRSERFRVNRSKQKVVRDNQRQTVTGVVVNERVNVSRREFDRLKATLTNCIRTGPLSQNRSNHSDFSAHLRGKIAHVMQLNADRGVKLLALYDRIDWQR